MLRDMDKNNQDNSAARWCLWLYVGIIILILLFMCFTSCSPRIVEHIVVQHDTTKVVRVDSIWNYQHDSVFVKEKGDTIYKYVEHVRYRDRVKIDTFYKVQVDSVAYETIKEVKVEKPLSWWQKFRMKSFWWLLGGLAVALIWIFRKPIWALIKLIFKIP